MRSSDFMRALPAAVRLKLPPELHSFKTAGRPWLVQLYFGGDPHVHYEAWLLAPRPGRGPNNREVEIGLHFESRTPGENERLLALCVRHLFEIKSELGVQVEAEPWSRGWTKVYEVLEHAEFNEAFLEMAALHLARFIEVLQPLMAPPPVEKPRGRRR